MVSIVNRASGKVIRTDIDAVVSTGVSGAINAAAKRNPLRPWESFAVSKASKTQVRRCCAISQERTDEITAFVELMSD
jgi:hypothetical protein